MQISVDSKHRPLKKLQKLYPGAQIIDLTSKAEAPFVRFSPFYPLGGIPIPFSEGHYAVSVEGLWQGLKVFESEGIDPKRFENDKMKGLKRTVRKYGQCLGHQKGLNSTELLGYIEARKAIYLPAYLWALENKLQKEVEVLKVEAEKTPIVLLDYETNGKVEDPAKPLSHAYLVKYYLEGNWPA
jgi:hypothetical protein